MNALEIIQEIERLYQRIADNESKARQLTDSVKSFYQVKAKVLELADDILECEYEISRLKVQLTRCSA